jgi:hypothetical protein
MIRMTNQDLSVKLSFIIRNMAREQLKLLQFANLQENIALFQIILTKGVKNQPRV